MRKIILTCFILFPVVTMGQKLNETVSIDNIIFEIESDRTIQKRAFDTVRFEKEDGGNNWDSLYIHREYFYRQGKLVKIVAYNKYGRWRLDMLGYYLDGKTLKYSQGESFLGSADYGKLNFEIYYMQDIAIKVSWLTKKPDYVLSLATESLLKRSYLLIQDTNAARH